MTAVDRAGEVQSRYVVGIDLGTTNSALGYVDTQQTPWRVETFRITQWVDVGQHEQRETLPSFHYELTASEASSTHGKLPWEKSPHNQIVGVLARDAGQRHPGRRIASAKSWLSHDGVDRSADFLPWQGDADLIRMSPVDVSGKYLSHLRAAWDHSHPNDPLDQQDIVITLPASFDEVARELTVLAAKRAGLRRVYLIEEPQAAFYAWIHSHADQWHKQITAGQLILVCDIGGGTTDFTLIRVQPAGDDSEQVQFHRVAVGNHLILGGDNLDLALAKFVEAKLTSGPLSPGTPGERAGVRGNEAEQKPLTLTLSPEYRREDTGDVLHSAVCSDEGTGDSLSADQWDRLIQVARVAKETMLSADRPDSYTLSLPSQGSKLIGGAIQVALTAAEIDSVLVDGFFPVVELSDRPSVGQSGFREFGLPYAADPAITRHLAAFLSAHRRSGLTAEDKTSDDRPAWLLFNGGVMVAAALRQRIADSLARWFKQPGEDHWTPQILASQRLDLAVAHGAAYCAMVRRGEGIKITANLGRTYYMQVSSDPPQAICLIPGNAEAGQRFQTANHPLELQLGQPVQFPLWVSSTRLADPTGALVTMNETEASRLPPIYTALGQGKKRDTKTIRVAIESELSEIGTVGMWCVDLGSGNRWQLEFDIRSTLETDRTSHQGSGEAAGMIDEQTILKCEAAIASVFAAPYNVKPNELISALQTITETKRDAWPPSLLRKMWQQLLSLQAGSRESSQHEARWLNLLGYCLRPGYGVAVDDWRVSQTWKTVYGKLAFPAPQSRTEGLILWRRIAGGMTSGQQQQLAGPLLSSLKEKSQRLETQELSEIWRLLASLERLSAVDKVELGRLAFNEFSRKKSAPIQHALLWAIGRLGNRVPVYGPLNTVIDKQEVTRWLARLRTLKLAADNAFNKAVLFAVVQLARRVGDRHRDIDEAVRAETVQYLASIAAPPHFMILVTAGGLLSSEEETAVFGETLPLGIRLATHPSSPALLPRSTEGEGS